MPLNAKKLSVKTLRKLSLLALPIIAIGVYGCGGGGSSGGSSGGGSSSSSSASAYVGGSEFLLNTTTDFDQTTPRLTTLSNGNIVAVWSSSLGTIGGIDLAEVRAQILSPSGAKIGGEIIVSNGTATSSSSHRHIQPSIVAMNNGGFVIVYISNGHLTAPAGATTSGPIFVRAYDAAGAALNDTYNPPLTTLFNGGLIGTNGQQMRPQLTKLSDGRLVMTWTEQSSAFGDGNSLSVKAQIYAADGQELVPTFVVNSQTIGQQSDQRIVALSNGGFVITWLDWNGSVSGAIVRKLKAQIYNSDGTPSGAEFFVSDKTGVMQSPSGLTALSNGRFVVTWSDNTTNPATDDLMGQIFESSGTKVGSEFAVATNAANRQTGAIMTTLSNGNFVVLWGDNSLTLGDTAGWSIKGQVFTSTGTKVATEFLVNTQTAGDQIDPFITPLNSDGFAAVWADSSGTLGDASGTSIKGRVFNFK